VNPNLKVVIIGAEEIQRFHSFANRLWLKVVKLRDDILLIMAFIGDSYDPTVFTVTDGSHTKN